MLCQHCNETIENPDSVECPNCEAVLKAAPARKEKNRPTVEKIAVVESSNYNGKYNLGRLTDGSRSKHQRQNKVFRGFALSSLQDGA